VVVSLFQWQRIVPARTVKGFGYNVSNLACNGGILRVRARIHEDIIATRKTALITCSK
jgi:hypothetical protein